MILRDVKILLDIDDDSKDNELEIYIRRAVFTIKNYLNTDKFTNEDIKDKFKEAVILLVENAYTEKAQGAKGIKSKSQGARSITYSEDMGFTISDNIKSMLPVPYIRMR